MKKILFILAIAFVMTFAFTSCKNNTEEVVEEQATEQVADTNVVEQVADTTVVPEVPVAE